MLPGRVMTGKALSICVLGALALACREGSTAGDGAAPGSRVVGNCLMDPSLCPSRFCLHQRDGSFICACADVPAGQTCSPCPAGYRYHSKYSTCEPTCDVVGPTCQAGQSCQEELGVAMCLPAGDGGAADAAGGLDTRPPPAARCSCSEGCSSGEMCLQNRIGSIGPTGMLQCSSEGNGLPECRTKCANNACPASRPHCIAINIAVGCCADYTPQMKVCCANADASSVQNCF